MFCKEPIIKVYAGNSESIETNSFLDCYHNNSIDLYLTKGYRYVLETEHYYISIGFDGVKLDKKQCSINEYEEKDEYLENLYVVIEDDIPWVYYEHTLFVGECLIEVKDNKDGYVVVFDDFSMNVIPHSSVDEIKGLSHWHYLHSFGCERLITRTCKCGGTGELFLDFVSDYFVRCNKCNISTWSEMNAINAIDAWNRGETRVDS